MMTTFVLLALFISTLKADICVSGEGNTYINFFGHYVELGEDSNGYMQYKEETMCGSDPHYLYNYDNQWGTSNSLGSPSLHIACQNKSASITSPLDCPQWSIDSVSVTNNDCYEVILPCNSIEISGASSSWNGVYKKFEGEDNLYKKKGDYYFLSYSTIRRAFYGTEDWDILCHSPSTYDLEIAQASLSSLSDGDELTFNPTFPSNREITIKCTGVDLCSIPLNQCSLSWDGMDSNYAYCDGTSLIQQTYWTTTDCTAPSNPPPNTGEDGITSSWTSHHRCCRDIVETPITPAPTTSSPTTSDLCPVPLNQCYIMHGGTDSNYAYCNGTWLTQQVYHTTTDCSLPAIPPPGTGNGMTSFIAENLECCPETPSPTTASPTTASPTTVSPTTSNSCPVTVDQCSPSHNGTDSNYAYCIGPWLIQQTYWTTTNCTLPSNPPPNTGDGMTSSIEENPECCPTVLTPAAPTTSNCSITLDQCLLSEDGANSNYAYCQGTDLIQETYWTTTNCTLPSNPPPNTGDGVTSSIAANPECCPEDLYEEE